MASRRQFFIVLLLLEIAVESTTKRETIVLDRTWRGIEEKDLMLFNNYFKTLEEEQIQFDNDDVKSLIEPSDLRLDKIDEIKKGAFRKYDSKCAALHCVNNLILLYILHNIKSSMLSGRIPKLENKTDFEIYKTHVARMLSVLYYFRLDACHWNVTVYTQLIVAIDPETYKQFIKEELFSDEDIHKSFTWCLKNKLIRKQEENVSVEDYIKSVNIDEIIKQFYYNDELQHAYKYADMFTPETITLTHFFKLSLLFQYTEDVTKVSWVDPQQQLNILLKDLDQSYKTHRWPFFIDEHMYYHLWVVQITYTSVMYHLWFHFKYYQFIIRTSKFRFLSKQINPPQNYWSLIAVPLKKAVQFFDIDDNLTLWIMNMVSNYNTTNITTRRVSNYYEQVVRQILLESFKEMGVDNANNIVNVSDPGRKEAKRLIEQNVAALEKYCSDIKDALYPIDNLSFVKFVSKPILNKNEASLSAFIKSYDINIIE